MMITVIMTMLPQQIDDEYQMNESGGRLRRDDPLAVCHERTMTDDIDSPPVIG